MSEEFIDSTTSMASDRELTAVGAKPQVCDVTGIDSKSTTIIKTIKVLAEGTVTAWKFIVRGKP